MAVQVEAAGTRVPGQAQTAPEADPDDGLPTLQEQQQAAAAGGGGQQAPPASQQRQQGASSPQAMPPPPAAAAAAGGAGQAGASPGGSEQSGAPSAASAGPAGGEQSSAQPTASPPPRKAYKDVLASPIASPFQALAGISAKNLQPQVAAEHAGGSCRAPGPPSRGPWVLQQRDSPASGVQRRRALQHQHWAIVRPCRQASCARMQVRS